MLNQADRGELMEMAVNIMLSVQRYGREEVKPRRVTL